MTTGDEPSSHLIDAISATLAEFEFRARRRAWYREVPFGVLAVNLQKSAWGDQYYLNLGAFVRALGDTKWPKAQECQFSIRAEVVDVGLQARWAALLNMEAAVPLERRTADLRALLVSQVRPLLDSISTTDGLRQVCLGRRYPHAAVRLSLMEYLQSA